jgi:hypothetical protein
MKFIQEQSRDRLKEYLRIFISLFFNLLRINFRQFEEIRLPDLAEGKIMIVIRQTPVMVNSQVAEIIFYKIFNL